MPCLLVCPVDKLQVMFRGIVLCPTMVVLTPHALFIGVSGRKLQVMFRGTVFCPTMVVLAPHALFIGVSGREAPSHV